MTVFRNDGRWDNSNVIFRDGADGARFTTSTTRTRPAADFDVHRLRALGAASARVVEQDGPGPGRRRGAICAELFHAAQPGAAQLAGLEVHRALLTRSARPPGLEDLERWIARQVLIVLDRDGVLNRTVPNPAEPRPDSPLRAGEVSVFPWVPGVLRALTDAGFGLVVASNQPAAAKGKTTRAALEQVARARAAPTPSARAASS